MGAQRGQNEQHFSTVLFISLYKVVPKILSLWMKSQSAITKMNIYEQYVSVVLFISLYEVV